MTGFGLAEGDTQASFELVNQIEGRCLAMAADDFSKVIMQGPNLKTFAIRFARALSMQVSYTALANGKFDVAQRLARWLLMIQDRVPHNPFHLTHEYLALMLGVRRPTVTDTLHILEGDRLIRASRNQIEIRDRKGLARLAGEIYGDPEREYLRLMELEQSST